MLKKDGNRLKYTDLNGESHLEYRKAWVGEKLDMIINDIANKPDIADAEETVKEVETESVNGE